MSLSAPRAAAVLGAGALLLATPHCLWDGLDDYSSQYGKTSPEDAGADGADADADAPEDGPPDGGACDCGPDQACVLGVCETCTPSWSVDHTDLRQGDILVAEHAFDRARRRVFVASSRQTAQGPRRGYLADVSSCRGTVLSVHDGDLVQGTAMPGLTMPSASAGALFVRLVYNTGPGLPAKLGGFARYDPEQGQFVGLFEPALIAPETDYQATWSLAASPSGKVWMAGDWTPSGDTVPTPFVLVSDGQGAFCSRVLPALAGANARAIAAAGDDVYITFPAPEGIRVQHYQDSACDTASCDCAPADELPLLPFASPVNVLAARVASSTLLVAGFVVLGPDDWQLFLAQYSFPAGAWMPVYQWDPTARLDGITALDTDGAVVYAGVFKNYVYGDPSTAEAEILAVPLPLGPNPMTSTFPVPKLRAVLSLDVDGDGLIMTGYSFDKPAEARTVRCPISGCQ